MKCTHLQGPQAGAPSPHVEAAGALCALTAHNSRSQDALRAVKAMPLLLQLLVEADAPALNVLLRPGSPQQGPWSHLKLPPL